MYHCPECEKDIEVCPHCKQFIKDHTATLIYQIAGALLFVSMIFFALEIKVKEEIDAAMKPFKMAEDIAAKKNKVKAVSLPKSPKPDKEPKKEIKKAESKSDDIKGKDADFRVGMWGTSRKKIEEEEKAERIARESPYSIDYLARVGNYDAVTRYNFSSGRLTGGDYVIFGNKVKNANRLREDTPIRIGDSCPTWVGNEFNLYRFPRNESLSDIANVEQFFYEMYLSLGGQFGTPESSTLGANENVIGRSEKVASVIAHNRMLSYKWQNQRSIIEFTFAGHDSAAFMIISYSDKKNSQGN